jgi:hypothetical protein
MLPKAPKHGRTKPGLIRDAGHLNYVRSLPCCICKTHYDIQAHHLLRTGEHAMGRRSGDNWAIPLCALHHTQLHMDGDEIAFLQARGIDGKREANELWERRANV